MRLLNPQENPDHQPMLHSLGSCRRGRDRKHKSKDPPAAMGPGVKGVPCRAAYDSALSFCPWKASACFLWAVTSFHTERFFFISLGSWDTWRLCFEIHILTTNYTALLPCCRFDVRSLCSPGSDLLRAASFSLGSLSPPQDFSAAHCPQGEWLSREKTEGERVSGSWGGQGPQESDSTRKPVSEDTCSTVCVSASYTKLPLQCPSGNIPLLPWLPCQCAML